MQVSLWGEGPLLDAALTAATALGWEATTGRRAADERHVIAVAPLAWSVSDCDELIARQTTGQRAFAWPMVNVVAVQQLVARFPQLGSLTDLSSRSTTPGSVRTKDLAASLLTAAHDQIALLLLLGQVGGLGLPDAVSMRSPSPDTDRIGLHYPNITSTIDVIWAADAASSLDVQVAGEGGVLRIETDPSTRLEHNGESVPLPASKPVDPALQVLRDAGVLDMLRTIGAAMTADRPIPHAFSFEFGRAVVAVADAAERSAGRDGAQVALQL